MHWLFDPIQYHYADFSGRASRQEFWMFYLYLALVYLIAAFFVGLFRGVGLHLLSGMIALCILIAFIAVIVPMIALSARRLHDADQSAWLLLLWFIPTIGCVVLFVFYCLPSNTGKNTYGPKPAHSHKHIE